MPHHEDRVGIAAVLLRVIMSPANCLGHIARHLFHRNLRDKAVVGRDKDESLVPDRLRLLLTAPLVSLPPSAAVNPDDDRMAAGRKAGRSTEAAGVRGQGIR